MYIDVLIFMRVLTNFKFHTQKNSNIIKSMTNDTKWTTVHSLIVTISYLSLYVTLVLFIILKNFEIQRSIKHNIRQIWKKRCVYGTVLVQIFDQASDIGVLMLWWQYASLEQAGKIDILHLDMNLLCSLSMISIASSRIMSAFIVLFTIDYNYTQSKVNIPAPVSHNKDLNINSSSNTKHERYFDALLCLFELYLIKQVWIIHKNSKIEESTPEMKSVKWIEAIFESIPQTVLQSVFFIRTFDSTNNKFGINNINQGLFLMFSLFWSVVSAANKFVVMDERDTSFDVSIHKPKLSTKVRIRYTL